MKESQLIKKAKDYVHSIGGVAYKIHGGPYSERGTPDLFICLRGKFIGAEAKLPKKMPTTVQDMQLNRILRADGFSFWFHSIEEFKTIIDRFLVVDKELDS